MNPGEYNLELYRGNSYAWQFRLWEDANKTVPFDLAGGKVSAQIRNQPGGTKVVDMIITVTEPNIVDMEMRPSMYYNCPLEGGWDIQVIRDDGQVLTPLAGTVTVTPDYTDVGG